MKCLIICNASSSTDFVGNRNYGNNQLFFFIHSVGRRNVFFIALANRIVFTLLLVWMPNIGLQLTCRFFQGLSFESDYLMPYIISKLLSLPLMCLILVFILNVPKIVGYI